jgi:hypothetical protein
MMYLGKGVQADLPLVQVIEGAQIKNKVLGQTHLFSGYSFNSANQPVIS